MDIRDFDSWEGCVAAMRLLSESGWQTLESDNPEIGMLGFSASRQTGGKEENVQLRWLVYGRQLQPQIHQCKNSQEFIQVLEQHAYEHIEPCNDPFARHIGFAVYDEANTAGIAKIYRIPMTQLKLDKDSATKLAQLAVSIRRRQEQHARAEAYCIDSEAVTIPAPPNELDEIESGFLLKKS